MPIEFRCARCQKLLRTPDDTAGRQAQCPECGERQTIPPPVAAPSPAPMHRAAFPGSHEGAGFAASPPAANPYQAPQSLGGEPLQAAEERNGPPWESRGPSPATFLVTARDTLFDTARMFRTMRRVGRTGAATGFAVAGALIALFAVMGQFFVLLLIGMSVPGEANDAGTAMLGYMVIFGCSLGIMPVVAILGLLLYSAAYHVVLSLIGEANHPFEATYRVVAYTHGATYLLMLVPCVGGLLSMVAATVVGIIGLTQVQETSPWTAAAAVLPPTVLCCGGQAALWMLSAWS